MEGKKTENNYYAILSILYQKKIREGTIFLEAFLTTIRFKRLVDATLSQRRDEERRKKIERLSNNNSVLGFPSQEKKRKEGTAEEKDSEEPQKKKQKRDHSPEANVADSDRVVSDRPRMFGKNYVPAVVKESKQSIGVLDLITGTTSSKSVPRPLGAKVSHPKSFTPRSVPSLLPSLPPNKASDDTFTTSTATSGVDCPICGDQLNNPHTAKCGHACCFQCWLKCLEVKLECPVCRQKARKSHLRPLYLL